MPFTIQQHKQLKTAVFSERVHLPGRLKKMKKFKIQKQENHSWLVSHNEFPKFTCSFEDKKFNYQKTITGLSNPSGDPKEVRLLEKMEKWLKQYHKEKING